MSTSTATTETNTSRITKRKLDDAISILDSAVHEQRTDDNTSNEQTGPSPKKRATTAKSIYASLSKYGFRVKDKSSEKTGSSRTPMLTSLLHRSHTISSSRASSNPTSTTNTPPTISLPQALASKPPYRPTSTADFLSRLSTFKLATYRDKPRATDAVAAARCGWKNSGQDRLVCDYCTAAWVVGSTAGMSREAANTLIERQRVGLTTSHKDSCPWRKRQCDPSIYRVPLQGSSAMAREIQTRARALTPAVSNVPLKHPLTTSQLATITAVMNTLADIAMSDFSPSPISQNALVLSLFGWELSSPSSSHNNNNRRASLTQSLSRATSGSLARGPSLIRTANGIRHSTDSGPGPSSVSFVIPSPVGTPPPMDDKDSTILCTMCQRRVGLWTFRTASAPPSIREQPVNGDGASPPGTPHSASSLRHHQSLNPGPPRRPVLTPRTLDVVKEHRSFCPYVVKSTPSLSYSLAGSNSAANANNASGPSGSRNSLNDETLVEGWRAVLSIVSRAGMGARRRRADIFGPLISADEEREDVEPADVDSMVESVKKGGSKELLRYVKGLLS